MNPYIDCIKTKSSGSVSKVPEEVNRELITKAEYLKTIPLERWFQKEIDTASIVYLVIDDDGEKYICYCGLRASVDWDLFVMMMSEGVRPGLKIFGWLPAGE